MTEVDGRAALLEAFTSCLNSATQGHLDLKSKYFQFQNLSHATVVWCLDAEWYVECELYDKSFMFLQRKVVTELQPGDFFILPPDLPETFKIFARSDHAGSFQYCSFEMLMSKIGNGLWLEPLQNK